MRDLDPLDGERRAFWESVRSIEVAAAILGALLLWLLLVVTP